MSSDRTTCAECEGTRGHVLGCSIASAEKSFKPERYDARDLIVEVVHDGADWIEAHTISIMLLGESTYRVVAQVPPHLTGRDVLRRLMERLDGILEAVDVDLRGRKTQPHAPRGSNGRA